MAAKGSGAALRDIATELRNLRTVLERIERRMMTPAERAEAGCDRARLSSGSVTDDLKPSYAGRVALRHAIETARKLGLDVAGFELAPDGTIRIMEARADRTPEDLFDRLCREGKL